MAQRKLQQEIDKTFKKVAEGIAIFEGIFDKIQQTNNASQKEKLEDALKREIKKLQRHRDQIKTWAAGNEIKDKKPLLEQRKAIENEMEKFKAVEKEMKTKAFSKEGLNATAKLDPKEKEKLEACEFLGNMVEELDRQIETLEAEEETLQATVKKGKKDTSKVDRLSEIAGTNERHKFHQGKLELLLRSLQNGNVETEQVQELEESIKYYVEENQSPDFMEDDTIYDDLNLEEDEEAFGMTVDVDPTSSHDAQTAQDEHSEPPDSKTGTITGKPKSTSISEPNAAGRRPSNAHKSTLPALATLHTPLPTAPTNATNTSMKPAPPPARPPGETLRYASAAAAAAADRPAVGIAPLPPPPSSAPVIAASSPAPKAASPALVQARPSGPSMTPITEAPKTKPKEPEQSLPAPRVASAKTVSHPLKVENKPPESVYHLPSGLQDLVQSFEVTKARKIEPESPAMQRLLQFSASTQPKYLDAEKPQYYRPETRFTTPDYYPQEPFADANDPSLFSKIDTDTLFYIFYYRQNTYQQYLAAKSLKAQSWRFHKQYQTWFQRHEEPKTITEEFEQGTYRFFDYESTWWVFFFHRRPSDHPVKRFFSSAHDRMNRRKADFRFQYKFLEDDL